MSLRDSSVVHFHYQTNSFHFPHRKELKAFLLFLFSKEKKELANLSIVFSTDESLLEINRTHLNHDFYTDIITFPLSASGEPIVSEIYISVDRVRDNALSFQTNFQSELHRVIFHGCLHLCGYLDKGEKAAALMRKKENYYLRQYFVSRETWRKV
jgi:probable rRNA maturation factor